MNQVPTAKLKHKLIYWRLCLLETELWDLAANIHFIIPTTVLQPLLQPSTVQLWPRFTAPAVPAHMFTDVLYL